VAETDLSIKNSQTDLRTKFFLLWFSFISF